MKKIPAGFVQKIFREIYPELDLFGSWKDARAHGFRYSLMAHLPLSVEGNFDTMGEMRRARNDILNSRRTQLEERIAKELDAKVEFDGLCIFITWED